MNVNDQEKSDEKFNIITASHENSQETSVELCHPNYKVARKFDKGVRGHGSYHVYNRHMRSCIDTAIGPPNMTPTPRSVQAWPESPANSTRNNQHSLLHHYEASVYPEGST